MCFAFDLLLRHQVWRERLLPLLERHLAESMDSVAAYHLLYQEAALANLLEVWGQMGQMSQPLLQTSNSAIGSATCCPSCTAAACWC
jgi:hypothetical protein